MSAFYKPESPADICIGHMNIWIHGRQYPESQDYCEGNCLNVTIHCESPQSEVMVTGSILYVSDLVNLKEDLERFYLSDTEKIMFESIEQHFKLALEKAEDKDKVIISITAEASTEKHYYYFPLERKDIRNCINNLERILTNYPVRVIG